jgi:hypothetical protein
MNIWDSVHRGLEKASSEAGRIAKGQRLRSSIDKVGRQINEREKALLNNVMQLFNAGVLTQAELLPLCQELMQTQQQLTQLQAELQQVQQAQTSTGAPAGNTGAPATVPPTQFAPNAFNTYPSQNSTNPYTDSGSQPYDQFYADAPLAAPPPPPGMADTLLPMPVPPPPPGVSVPAEPMPVPPPPPGVPGFTVSALPTQLVPQNTPTSARQCTQCGVVALHTNAFCQNCGTPLENAGVHQPTVMVSNSSPLGFEDQGTVRATGALVNPATGDDGTRLDETPEPLPVETGVSDETPGNESVNPSAS